MSSVRQHILIAVPIRQVWAALTTAEGWKSWWAEEARVDGRDGGRISLTVEGDDGEPVEERGVFVGFLPTRRLEIKWDPSSPAKTKSSRVQIRLARDGDETRISIVHSGLTELFEDEEQREALDKEWRSALKALRSTLEA